MRRRELLRAAGGLAGGVALAGCEADPPAGECPELPAEPNYRGYLDDVGTYERTCDRRNFDSVTVDVGVQGGAGHYKFGPPAVAVSPGTEVTWEWTGRGGAHNVVAERGGFASGAPVDEDGHTFAHTFEAPAIYTYRCEPHVSHGMKGAVYVALGDSAGP